MNDITTHGDEFIVDNDPNWRPLDAGNPLRTHPGVALTNSTDLNQIGAFIVVWNARISDPERDEVHAQYFSPDGGFVGGEFRVHVTPSEEGAPRRLAPSARHTVAYGPAGQVVVTYTEGEQNPNVWFTMLPPRHFDSLCCKGDVNGDGAVDGDDIQTFSDTLLNGFAIPRECPLEPEVTPSVACAFDTNDDGALTQADVAPFVAILLNRSYTCPGAEAMGLQGGDSPGGQDAGGDGSSNEDQIDDYVYVPSAQEQLLIDWLRANPYHLYHHFMTIEEYGAMFRDVAVDFGVVKRWSEE